MTVEFARGKSYVVDRGKPKTRAGQGMLAGLDVVIRHFFSAFGKKVETQADTSGVFTVQYPEERLELPQAFRNFPILLYDDATGHELCTSCFQCERICPPQVIHMSQATDPVTGKAIPAVNDFIIEYDACMSCGLCAEVCPFDAIKMDHEFELATSDHLSMTVDKAGLDRPISYYQAIAPRFWEEVKESALKKLQGNMKRRSGNIGITPSFIGKAKKAAPAAAKPAAGAATPAAAVGKNMSEDKLARLAAIRAANAGGAPAAVAAPVAADEDDDGVEATAPVAAAPTRIASSTGLPFSADNILGGVPANTAMVEDKVERLKSIRSGNLAKGE
jgi:NADH-quinone oxidoreductase subunit I